MSQFFTLSFELEAPESKATKIVNVVKQYLANEGAKDVLFTRSGEPDEDKPEAERSDRLGRSSKSRAR